MNAQTNKPLGFDTPEAILKSLEPADSRHSVIVQFGNTTATFYNVPTGFAIDGKDLAGWLAMPLQDSHTIIRFTLVHSRPQSPLPTWFRAFLLFIPVHTNSLQTAYICWYVCWYINTNTRAYAMLIDSQIKKLKKPPEEQKAPDKYSDLFG